MLDIHLSLRNILAAKQQVQTPLEDKALSENARFAISQYLIRLEKDRFFVDCSAAGKTPAEAEQTWQAARKQAEAPAKPLDASIAKGLAAGVFAGLRR